jgi:phytoene/squalene synthetase
MSEPALFFNPQDTHHPLVNSDFPSQYTEQKHNLSLPVFITRMASKQTYHTIRFLVDRERVMDAYRAYAYFRWVDDTLDHKDISPSERLAFVRRQQTLMNSVIQNIYPRNLTPEECFLVDLVQNCPEQESGLHIYLQHMMKVMEFDATRRGRLISQQELDTYSWNLALAVTEAMHYFIGHECYSPHDETRYHAVIGAHITHMLRDTPEDTEAGYFNISREFIETYGIVPHHVESDAYRTWVQHRVQLARNYFSTGRIYLSQVESRRCRVAGYAYMTRFEQVLNLIERDDYHLRRTYPERKGIAIHLQMIASMLIHGLTR